MKLSPLVTLRLGSPGQPSAAAIAARMKVSKNALSLFEQGRSSLSVDNMKLYAKAVGSTLREVQTRWLQARLDQHEIEIARIRVKLRELGVASLRSGRPAGRRLARTG